MGMIGWNSVDGSNNAAMSHRPFRSAGSTSRRRTASGVRSASRRRRDSAASSSDDLGFVVVTYPFHPLTGQRLEVLYVKRRGADTVFVCSGGASGLITLPLSWTDRAELPRSERLSAEGLAEFAAATRAI